MDRGMTFDIDHVDRKITLWGESIRPNVAYRTAWCDEKAASKQTQNICITFIQRRPNVFDVGPTLYECYTNVLCLLGCVCQHLQHEFSHFLWLMIILPILTCPKWHFCDSLIPSFTDGHANYLSSTIHQTETLTNIPVNTITRQTRTLPKCLVNVGLALQTAGGH